MFFSAGIGGDIIGNHINVFTGLFRSYHLNFIHYDKSRTFGAFVISNGAIRNQIEKCHKKSE